MGIILGNNVVTIVTDPLKTVEDHEEEILKIAGNTDRTPQRAAKTSIGNTKIN